MGSPGSRARLPNITAFEEIALCHAYILHGVDPTVGNSQSQGTMWNKIARDYQATDGIFHIRTIKCLQSRWTTISRECMLYASKLAHAYGPTRASGTINTDWVNRAREDFHRDAGHSFAFDHCYEILKDLPKFNLTTTATFMEGGSQSNSNTATDEHIDLGNDDHEMHTPLERPIGRSGEKRKSKKNSMATSSATHAALLENSERFTASYNENAAHSRRARDDLNSKLDELIDIRRKEYENSVICADTTNFTPQQMAIYNIKLAEISKRHGF